MENKTEGNGEQNRKDVKRDEDYKQRKWKKLSSKSGKTNVEVKMMVKKLGKEEEKKNIRRV